MPLASYFGCDLYLNWMLEQLVAYMTTHKDDPEQYSAVFFAAWMEWFKHSRVVPATLDIDTFILLLTAHASCKYVKSMVKFDIITQHNGLGQIFPSARKLELQKQADRQQKLTDTQRTLKAQQAEMEQLRQELNKEQSTRMRLEKIIHKGIKRKRTDEKRKKDKRKAQFWNRVTQMHKSEQQTSHLNTYIKTGLEKAMFASEMRKDLLQQINIYS
jgi:hypothetical protein